MNAKVHWKGRMGFEATADSGFRMDLDASPDVGGDDAGFRPMELMALSLAGCTAMDVISILQKKRQNVTAFDVDVQAERAEEHPKVFTRATIIYRVDGQDVDEAAVRRAIELSAERYCPAQAMLGRIVPLTLRYEIHNAGQPLITGEYTPA